MGQRGEGELAAEVSKGAGGVHIAHSSIMLAGKPSVFFRRKLVQIWGSNWMHQQIVPMRPKMVAARGAVPVCASMVVFVW